MKVSTICQRPNAVGWDGPAWPGNTKAPRERGSWGAFTCVLVGVTCSVLPVPAGYPRGLTPDRPTAADPTACAFGYGVFAGGFEKSTLGAVRAPGVVTSKYSRCFAPVTFAVSDCGSVRMYVL